jgi:hypothetical protein
MTSSGLIFGMLGCCVRGVGVSTTDGPRIRFAGFWCQSGLSTVYHIGCLHVACGDYRALPLPCSVRSKRRIVCLCTMYRAWASLGIITVYCTPFVIPQRGSRIIPDGLPKKPRSRHSQFISRQCPRQRQPLAPEPRLALEPCGPAINAIDRARAATASYHGLNPT